MAFLSAYKVCWVWEEAEQGEILIYGIKVIEHQNAFQLSNAFQTPNAVQLAYIQFIQIVQVFKLFKFI